MAPAWSQSESRRSLPQSAVRADVGRLNDPAEAAVAGLESGSWITYDDYTLTGSDCGIIEFPDGRRYSTRLQFLGAEKVAVEIIERLSDAIR